MGVVIFAVMCMYLLISVGVVIWAVTKANKTGKSAIRWGLGAAFVMYMIPFWDWIPTVVVHKYYCEKEAGFWVYKSLEQWKAENPGVMEGLVMKFSFQSKPYGDLQIMNERFAIETHRSKPIPLLPTNIAERLLVDQKTGEVLAKGVDIGSSVGNMATGGGLKFWLNQEPCVARDFSKLTFEIENSRRIK